MEKTMNLYVLEEDPGRLDSYIADKGHISRNRAQKLIADNLVTLNGEESPKPSAGIKKGDLIFVRIPFEKETQEVEKEEIEIDVIYEDDDIIVVNKQRGMVVHPAPGNESGTLVNALLNHADEIEDVGEEGRPGIVHRLDKNTSGLLVVAKNPKAHQKLGEMFKLRKVDKEYLALVYGKMKGREGFISLPVGRHPRDRKKMAVVSGGKEAVTRWKLKQRFENYTLLSVFIDTGRTHQIRVHLQYVGHPVVGDPEYAGGRKTPSDISGQALHSYRLGFNHPVTGKPMSFTAPIPEDMEELLATVKEDG